MGMRAVYWVAALPVLLLSVNGLYDGVIYRASPALYWVKDVTEHLLLPLACAWWLARHAGLAPRDYGLPLPPRVDVGFLGTGVVVAALLFAAYFLPQPFLCAWVGCPRAELSPLRELPPGGWRSATAVYMALSAGLMESIFFIGVPWAVWRDRLRWGERGGWFVLLASTAFAAAHWEQGWFGALAALAFGFVACRLFVKLRELWPIVIAHTLVDLVVFL